MQVHCYNYSTSFAVNYLLSLCMCNCKNLLFLYLLQQLYMHCIMSVSSSVPTPTAKSCNYDTKARRLDFP